MAETLGSLCDKLTIVKLKEFHSDDPDRKISLAGQAQQLAVEIDVYVADAAAGRIDLKQLEFPAHKVFNAKIGRLRELADNIGELAGQLAAINCELWHEQEKVYDFENVPADEKNTVVKRLGILNLERNKCIDLINHHLAHQLKK